jgi:sirohydrochlorin cobaltochelatase
MAEEPDRWPHAALVLVGHGSSRNPHGGATTRRHADEIRRRDLFSEVAVGFWRQQPFLGEVLATVKADEVYVVPNLTCKGHITARVIPREMDLSGPVTEKEGRRIYLCDPVGSHPRVAEIVARRIGALELPVAETGVLVVGHGTTKDDASALQTRLLADHIGKFGIATTVAPAFLEIPPLVKDWTGLLATPKVVVAPFLMAAGQHGSEDIPALLGLDTATPGGPQACRGRMLWVMPPVGDDLEMAEIILDRVAGFGSTTRP